MRGYTHLAVGAALGVITAHFFHTDWGLMAGLGGVAGLLPDVDHPKSLLGRHCPLGHEVSRPWPKGRVHVPFKSELNFSRLPNVAYQTGRKALFTLWHRGPTHSWAMGVLFAFMLYQAALALLSWHPAYKAVLSATGVGVAVLVGYFSHLVLDGFNKAPQMLFWPFSRRYHYMNAFPHFYQASTASSVLEGTLCVASIVGSYFVIIH